MKNVFKGKVALVTGGSGSIGSEIARQLLKLGAETVRIFSNDEDGQFNLQHRMSERRNVRYLLGDLRDPVRLRKAMEGVDVVFHAAALKHVTACELNPFEAVMTNVVGTRNLVEAALDAEVSRVVTISTDKAANPVNVLGATKLLAERLTTSAEYHKGPRKTVFCSVRFGNVLASRGSVVPIFTSQIRDGGPVTLTDPGMTRFVMSIPDSVALVLEAASTAVGGETFILKMPALKVGDLATAIVETMAERTGKKKVAIKIVGMRRGEKYHEELMNETEARNAFEAGHMFVLVPPEMDRGYANIERAVSAYKRKYRRAKVATYSSGDQTLLTPAQVRKLLTPDVIPF